MQPSIKVKIKQVRPSEEFYVPQYKTAGAAGVDLCATEYATLKPLERRLVKTNLALEIPPGYEGQVRSRSGMALKHGLVILNQPGTIDSDYRGEVFAMLVNLSSEDFDVYPGLRVAQIVFSPVAHATLVTEDLSETVRGSGGFGSTGK